VEGKRRRPEAARQAFAGSFEMSESSGNTLPPASGNGSGFGGNRLNDLTWGLNWYLNQYMKFQFNYIHSMLANAAHGASDFDTCAVRAQLDFWRNGPLKRGCGDGLPESTSASRTSSDIGQPSLFQTVRKFPFTSFRSSSPKPVTIAVAQMTSKNSDEEIADWAVQRADETARRSSKRWSR
jgi:hypothetical protein